MAKPIKWITKTVLTSKVKKTPKNYKIQTELGRKRLQESLKKFGRAGTVVVNTDMFLIDGNSRLQEAIDAGDKYIQVSMPNRKLSAKEFTEMSAMFDFAKAGEVDMEAIEKDLGTAEDFYKGWGLEVPMQLLSKLGKKAPTKELEYTEDTKAGAKVEPMSGIKMVSLFFNEKQEIEFRKIEELLKKRFKTVNVTDTVLKAFKILKNG